MKKFLRKTKCWQKIATKLSFHFGFTLAEVLITLGVIGTVAALTIPTLFNEYREMSYTTSLKVAYSILNSAFNTLKGENYDLTNISGADRIEKSKTLTYELTKVIKSAKVDTGDNIFGPVIYYKPYKNNTPTTNSGICNASYCYYSVLANGMLFQFASYGDCLTNTITNMNICGYLEVDINGKAPPNMGGEDLFEFLVSDSYQIIAFGDPRMLSPYYCQANAPDWTHTRGCTYVRLFTPDKLP
jgi:prepilin-type N-terminal cleavage/methylation domain-containing protein